MAEDRLPWDAPVYFDGKTYDPALDEPRLESLLWRVWALMTDGEWRTLAEIQHIVGGTEASVSARLRDLRKERFGSYEVTGIRVGTGRSGLWRYRVTPRDDSARPPRGEQRSLFATPRSRPPR